jgi:hypothetical protein
MTKDEALSEALELLNCWVRGGNPEDYWQEIDTVADAVKDALEGPEQGPVAWVYEVNGAHTILDLCEPPDDAYDEGTLYPLYIAPPKEQQSCDKRQPLTDFEIVEALMPVNVLGEGYYLRIARAIEAAHGIGKKT